MPTPSFGPFSNPYGRSFQWLANPQVQEELKLTDDQWDKIKQAQEEMSKKDAATCTDPRTSTNRIRGNGSRRIAKKFRL